MEAETSAKASQEAECKENESACMLEVKALKQQKRQLEEEIRAAETQAMEAAEAEAESQKAMAQAEERRRMELQAERKDKEQEVEEFRVAV